MKIRGQSGVYALTAATVLVGSVMFAAAGSSNVSATHFIEMLYWVSEVLAFEQAEFWGFFAALFAIMNPLIAVPLFARITKQANTSSCKRLATVSSTTIFLALLIAAVVGQELLGFFAISIGAFRIAGGIIVLLMGLAMLRSQVEDDDKEKIKGPEASSDSDESQAVCPIAIPLLAGPGAIVTIILQSQGVAQASDYGMIFCAIALIVLLTYLTLLVAAPIARALGRTGLMVATRLIGMIVAAIAVDMLVIGLKHSLPGIL